MTRILVEESTRASSNRLGSDIVIRPAAAEVPCGERIIESQECCGKEFSDHTWQEPDLEKSDRILAYQPENIVSTPDVGLG